MMVQLTQSVMGVTMERWNHHMQAGCTCTVSKGASHHGACKGASDVIAQTKMRG